MSQHLIIKDIPYTLTNTHPRQVLDLYLPTKLPTIPLPLVLYIHGGAFRHGSKESPLLPVRQVIENNYAVAAINYRRSGEAPFPAMIQDCKSALRFLRSPATASEHSLDPDRIVVWGESAGGHAAAFLGTTSKPTTGGSDYDVGDFLDIPSHVVGVVDYYGPTDFLSMDAYLPEGYRTHGDADSPESLYLAAQISTVPDLVKEADPCSHVEELVKRYRSNGNVIGGTDAAIPKIPAFFIAHGTADKIVPEHMSKLLVAELEKQGMDVEYLAVEGTDHVFHGISEEQQRELDGKTDRFLRGLFGGGLS